jgi:hypothetical protein
MQRFSAWARWIATAILAVVAAIFTGVVFPVVSHFIQEQPQETANVALKILHAALKFLYDLSEQTWFRITASMLVGFVAGLRLDGSRADERKALGAKMLSLDHDLSFPQGPIPTLMHRARPQIVSCFTAARKFGIWAPDQRVLAIHPDRARGLITDYLGHIGTMLKDGHFLAGC